MIKCPIPDKKSLLLLYKLYNKNTDENIIMKEHICISSKLIETCDIADITDITDPSVENSLLSELSINFYLDVLNAIDNMILLDYLRDNVITDTLEPVDYYVTKTLDLNLDLALAYYAVKYPLDTTVDQHKLDELIEIIKDELGIC